MELVCALGVMCTIRRLKVGFDLQSLRFWETLVFFDWLRAENERNIAHLRHVVWEPNRSPVLGRGVWQGWDWLKFCLNLFKKKKENTLNYELSLRNKIILNKEIRSKWYAIHVRENYINWEGTILDLWS